jgi:molybdopterin biosynthesis enzyme
VDGKLVVQTDGKMKSHLLQLLESKHVFARIEPGESLRAGDLVPIVPFSNSMLALL